MARASTFDYSNLLKRARDELPEELSGESRWSIPELELLHEGRTTIIRNWREIVDTLRRDREHILSYLLREVGTAGDGDEERVVFMGKISPHVVQEKLQSYVDTFVMCEECHRPDTHLTKDGRITLLKCDACGAHKPVKARKRRAGDAARELAEGKVIELAITGANDKGVPFGMREGVKIFVPGGEQGKTIRVRIERFVGQSAVAKPAE